MEARRGQESDSPTPTTLSADMKGCGMIEQRNEARITRRVILGAGAAVGVTLAHGRLPVVHAQDATPAGEGAETAVVVDVTFSGEKTLLDSAAAIEEAAAAGTVTLDPTDVIVNYPLVVWPDGGLPVDPDLTMPLAGGPLIEEPDLENGLVTFK